LEDPIAYIFKTELSQARTLVCYTGRRASNGNQEARKDPEKGNLKKGHPPYTTDTHPYFTYFYPEDGGNRFLQNVGNHLQDYIVS
jgi:hypothetical protein